MRRSKWGATAVAAGLVLSLSITPGAVSASQRPSPGSPISVPGARTVDLRGADGTLERLTSIPSTSMFQRYGGRSTPCRFVSPMAGVTSDGQHYVGGQTVESQRWMFVEGMPLSMGESSPVDPSVHLGPLATAVRYFTVFCDSLQHSVGFVAVSAHDTSIDPHLRLTDLYHRLQLVRPVVYPNPVVAKWGGLITRYPAWLAITPAAWTAQRSNTAVWRGWTMYLLTRPVAMDFVVDFTPDPRRPSAAFHGVVACVRRGASPSIDLASVPSMPSLPTQSLPGVNGSCRWTPPGPGSVVVQARLTVAVTFWASGYTEALADYVWTSRATRFAVGELAAVNAGH